MALKLVTDEMTETLSKAYAIRSDENKVPLIEEVQYYVAYDQWNREIFTLLNPVKYKNELYPYDSLVSGYIGSRSISDCYSKGYVFHTKSDAIRRIEILLEKKVKAMEEKVSEVASWKSRLAIIKKEK